MDIFPRALTNRDMNTLMRVIEESSESGIDSVIPEMSQYEDPDNLDEVKSAVSQMSSREMNTFLRKFEVELSRILGIFQEVIPSPGDLEYVEDIRSMRESIATVHSLRERVRTPRRR